jgi:bacterioferritin (cytochrome b1)
MHGEQQLIEYLNKALRHELAAPVREDSMSRGKP